MGLKLVKLDKDHDFVELSRVERDSYEDPNEPMIDLFFPIQGKGNGAREAALKDAAARHAAEYSADPTAYWWKVVDEDTDELLGAALWHVYDENPFATKDDIDATWFPEGEERTIANDFFNQLFSTRATYMQGPHVFFDISFTAPDARKRGVMSMLVERCVEDADRLGYETYLDASLMAKSLYEKFGFVEHKLHSLTAERFPETEKRKYMEDRFLPSSWWSMYRPIRGHYEKCKTILPWEKEQAKC